MTASPGPPELLLQPQEIPLDHPGSRYTFVGELVATPAALEAFGLEVILVCYAKLRRQAHLHRGIDYLQVFVDPFDAKRRLWFIDDVDHVTALLPSDY